jgi:hypothetical protein
MGYSDGWDDSDWQEWEELTAGEALSDDELADSIGECLGEMTLTEERVRAIMGRMDSGQLARFTALWVGVIEEECGQLIIDAPVSLAKGG